MNSKGKKLDMFKTRASETYGKDKLQLLLIVTQKVSLPYSGFNTENKYH